MLCREAMLGVGFFLQGGEVVKERCLLHLSLGCDLCDDDRTCFFHLIIYVGCGGFVCPSVGRCELQYIATVCINHTEVYLPERFRLETLVFPIAFAHHAKGRSLHTTYGIGATSCGYRQGLCAVDADEPVCLTSCLGCMIEIVILLAVPEVLKSLTDGGVRKRTDPETVERFPATEIRIEVSENQLSLTSGIGCYDNALTAVKQLADNFNLGKHTCIWFVAVLCLDLSGNKNERVGNHRQILCMESLHAVGFRHGWLH